MQRMETFSRPAPPPQKRYEEVQNAGNTEKSEEAENSENAEGNKKSTGKRQGKISSSLFSASDLLTCVLPTFCLPTIWAISLELNGDPPFWRATTS